MNKFLLLSLLSIPALAPLAAEPLRVLEKPVVITVRKIWDKGGHNAFTDLVRFKGAWYCVFREGAAHVSPDGAIRVLQSDDGQSWRPVALLADAKADLRDPKLTITPRNTLQLSAAAALHPPAGSKHRSLTWFSDDGRTWSEPAVIGEPNLWLWRITWHKDRAFSVGYDTAGEKFVRFYSSADGRAFQPLVPNLFSEGYPNETSLVFLPDQTLLCLLRRDGPKANGLLGVSKPPYESWRWNDAGARIGGPHLIRLPDGRIIAAVRLYEGGARTSLAWLDAESGLLTECLKLPSGGDTSYAGLAWHENLLWVSYYSSHEGKTSIYLAQVKVRI